MEYCVQVWKHVYVCDILKLENVQNKMTKLLRNGHLLTNAQRNSLLNITSHERRSLRVELVNMCKTLNDSNIFTLRNDFRTRGNDGTLKIRNWKKDTIRLSLDGMEQTPNFCC